MSIETDFVFFCNGAHINSSAYQSAFADVVNEHVRDTSKILSQLYFSFALNSSSQGEIQVNEYLQVKGHANVFAIGDCCSADRKMGFLAGIEGYEWERRLKGGDGKSTDETCQTCR